MIQMIVLLNFYFSLSIVLCAMWYYWEKIMDDSIKLRRVGALKITISLNHQISIKQMIKITLTITLSLTIDIKQME